MQEIYRHIISLDTDEFNRTFDTNQKCLDFIIRELYDGEVRSPFCDSSPTITRQSTGANDRAFRGNGERAFASDDRSFYAV